METSSLSHSRRKTTSIRKLVFLLSRKFSPLRIYEFSGRSWNGKQESCKDLSHCLLLITEQVSRIDYQVQDFVNRRYKNGTVTVICHDRQAIGIAIAANSRFFITVLTQGKLLYSNEQMLGYEPIKPYDPSKARQRAQELFNYRMPIARSFFAAATECNRLGHYTIGTFLLHQCTEQALICMIRVHLGYRSEFHNIHRLLRLCLSFSPRPYHTLLDIEDDGRLFNQLAKSYSSARYHSVFSISEADSLAISDRVYKLLSLTEEMYFDQVSLLERIVQGYIASQVMDINYHTAI